MPYEEVEESAINTFILYVDLPIFPNIFFSVIFNCNGTTFTSDEFNNANDALEWAQEELATFGTWSLDGDTLGLSDSLCSVGSLTVQQSSTSSIEEAALELDSSSPQAILDIYGMAAVDVSNNAQKATNTAWKTAVSGLAGLFIEPITGSTSQWALYKSVGSDGYNIVLAEVTARGKNINTLLDGVGAETYGYGFFEDALAYIVGLSPEPQIVVSIDLIRPVLNGSYAQTEDEIDYIVSACATAGITLRSIQLCYELGLSDNDDVFSGASAISVATQTVATYIAANYPTVKISIDANLWDDANPHFPTLNSLMNAVTDVDYVRQYFQFDNNLTTYELNRDHVSELPEMLNFFRDEFTNGQKIRLAQSTFKGSGGGNPANPMRNKVGEGLVYAELLINIIKENIARGNPIIDFAHFNMNRLVNSNGTTLAAYDFMVLFRDAFLNDGMIEYTIDNDDLVILAVKSGVQAELYIVNPTSDFIEIDSVALNGTAKDLIVESYYGEPTSSTAEHYEAEGTSILCYPHSLTKVITT